MSMFDNGFKPKRYDPERKPCDRCAWQPWETEVWRATIVFVLLMTFAIVVVSNARREQDQKPAPVPAKTTTYAGARR